MGKRKSARKPGAGKVKIAPLDKSFKCLFCSHLGTVGCKLDKPAKKGRLDCRDCQQVFTCDINHLTQPVDVYAEWIDACELVNKQNYAPPAQKRRRNDSEDADDDSDRREDSEEAAPRMKLVKKGKSLAQQEREMEEENEELPDILPTRREDPEEDEEEEEPIARKGNVLSDEEES